MRKPSCFNGCCSCELLVLSEALSVPLMDLVKTFIVFFFQQNYCTLSISPLQTDCFSLKIAFVWPLLGEKHILCANDINNLFALKFYWLKFKFQSCFSVNCTEIALLKDVMTFDLDANL